MNKAQILLMAVPVGITGCTLSRDGTSLFETVQNNPSSNPNSSSQGGSAGSPSVGGGGGESGMSGNGGVSAGGASGGSPSGGGGSGGVFEGGSGGSPQGGSTASGGTSSEGGGGTSSSGGSSSLGGFGGSGGSPQGGSGGQPGCPLGEKDCNGSCVSLSDPAYGCEDPNCAPCSFPHADAICTNSVCAPGKCDAGYADCNNDPPSQDGCEAHLSDDPENCGMCGKACPSNACQAGICNPLCNGNKIIPTVGIALCWIAPDHPAGTYIGLGGLADQPNALDLFAMVFPSCIASSPQDAEAVCSLGKLEAGTLLQLYLRAYTGNVGDPPPFHSYMCDQAGFPSSDCKGKMELYKNGALISTFEDDNLAATPPPAPWKYVWPDSIIELVYPSVP